MNKHKIANYYYFQLKKYLPNNISTVFIIIRILLTSSLVVLLNHISRTIFK